MADDQGDEDAPQEVQLTQSELNNGLIAASKLGRVGLVTRVLAKGADVHFVEELPKAAASAWGGGGGGAAATSSSSHEGWTALHHAAYNGHHRVVDVLLKNGAASKYKESIEKLASDGEQQHHSSSTHQHKTLHCINSPLSWAVLRGHLRVAWLLLQAGYSTLDVDQSGNTCLHLAAACVAPNRVVRMEMLRTILCAGFDPEAKNWLGQKPVEMFPTEGGAGVVEARKLLALASSTTKCATSGTPFGADQLRYLCYSSNKFLCEEASVSATVPAYAPSIVGVTVEAEDMVMTNADIRKYGGSGDDNNNFNGETAASIESKRNAYRYGVGIGLTGIFVASHKSDAVNITRPVRFGADVSYRVADAESALESALNPYPDAVKRALEAAGMGSHKSSSDAVDAAAAEGEATSNDDQNNNNTNEGDTIPQQQVPAIAETPAVPVFDLELELYLQPEAITALDTATSHVRDLHGDVHLIAKGMTALHRVRTANKLREACTALSKKRPLELTVGATEGLESAITAAIAAGVGATLLAQARLLLRVAVAEASLAGAVAVCGAIPVGTHAYDADIGRLSAAIKEAEKSSAEAVRVESGGDVLEEPEPEVIQVVSIPSTETAGEAGEGGEEGVALPSSQKEGGASGGAEGEQKANDEASGETVNSTGDATGAGVDDDGTNGDDTAAASTTPEETAVVAPPKRAPRPKLDIPALASNTIRLTAVTASVVENGKTLLGRLECEVRVTDRMKAGEVALKVSTQKIELHKEEDPTLLPTPEIPVDPVAEAAAAAAAAAVPAGKPAPAPAPAAAAADGTAPPPPPPNPEFPCDTAGVPIPDTPQWIALRSLRDACADLEAVITVSKSAGADAACIASAEATLTRLRGEMMAALTAEVTRVEFYRAERAKLEKKNKKKKK